jgi:hypothetical protein
MCFYLHASKYGYIQVFSPGQQTTGVSSTVQLIASGVHCSLLQRSLNWIPYKPRHKSYTQPDFKSMSRRGGHTQLFFESTIAIPQVKGAIPQSQCHNFLRNVAPQLQLRNRNFF